MNVFYFNPDNDLAIANGGEYYTPTPIAEQLRRDLQLLPCWLADDGDCVLCDSNKWQQWVENKGLKVKRITKNDLSVLDNVTFRPWGWNPAIRKQLITWGANEDLLPSKSNIEHIRKLAHRRTTIDIHRRLTEITSIIGMVSVRNVASTIRNIARIVRIVRMSFSLGKSSLNSLYITDSPMR